MLDGYRTRLTGLTPTEAETMLLIGFGSAVEVLSPPELQAELARLAADVLALYS